VTRSKLLRTTIVSFAGAAVVGQSALAAGEPKNQWPFTRTVATRAAQAAARPTAQHQPAIQGEAKNELPFTRPANVVVVANDTATGFDWTAGGIGAAAGLGVALTGAGALLVTRRSPRMA
jgi:hypothetical protein